MSTRWWRRVSEAGLPAEHQQGHELAAIPYFERKRAAYGPPGLLSEEYDVTQRHLRGNLPQAFVHALLLECAATLTGPRADAGYSSPYPDEARAYARGDRRNPEDRMTRETGWPV
jgi:hypothetical protein